VESEEGIDLWSEGLAELTRLSERVDLTANAHEDEFALLFANESDRLGGGDGAVL
jgi:hypothetical protein